MKVALIESKPSRTDFVNRFDNSFEFERFALCSDSSKKKILKADVDIDIDTEQYDWLILVGSDALKYFMKISIFLLSIQVCLRSNQRQNLCGKKVRII